MGNEWMVPVNGVELCVETFGAAGDPAVLLIGGAAMAMDWWRDGFCELLAAGGRWVSRYDHRDTGRSVTYPPGKPEYTGRELIEDAVGVLDALGVRRAHLVGISMGGGLAQALGVERPDRVASLTLLATSPDGPGPDNGLPAMAPRMREHFANPRPAPDWSDRAAVIDYLVADERPFAGERHFDEAERRKLVGRIFDRSTSIASMSNHWTIDGGEGEPIRPRLGRITAPTLVIHGTDDPFFPYGHAEALAKEIPGARLIPLDGAGHEVPPPAFWDKVVTALVAHTS